MSFSQIAGGHVIIDLDGLSLHHITYLTPSFAKMVVDFVQKCLPGRLKSIHFVRQSFVFNIAFGLFKPFLEVRFRELSCEFNYRFNVTWQQINFFSRFERYSRCNSVCRTIWKRILFNLTWYFLQEKFRKRLFFHGTNWESLMTSMNTNKKTLLKKHGGDLEMPEEPYGEIYWKSILYLSPFIKCNHLLRNSKIVYLFYWNTNGVLYFFFFSRIRI